MLNGAITVRQLNTYVKNLIEGDSRLTLISVTGEISNFKNHYQSGHWYFTLKDSDAAIRCVMFRASAIRVKLFPQDGMRVTLRGRVSLYEKDGQYQFYAEDMLPDGAGDIAAAFAAVKQKLEAEGMFAAENKRPLVKYPKRIAVITSDTGAAVKDILNITARRYPLCEIVMCPVAVQGELAARDMISALERVYGLGDVDTIIIGRGGGSAEDLAAFNDEALARKIYESPIPVILAVGHETDFTICDFVADVRASTPSHAAELAVPDGRALLFDIFAFSRTFSSRLNAKYQLMLARYKAVCSRRALSHPTELFDSRLQQIDLLTDRLKTAIVKRNDSCSARLAQAAARLDALSPLKTLSRGFAVAQKADKTVRSVKELNPDDDIKLTFFDGSADCKVTATLERKE